MQTFIRELWELDKPTIAAVNGAAVGPGAHLALACDFVFVHPRTRFMWSFAKWGLVADAGGAYLLPRLVGLPRAKAMVMLGEGATGAEAVDLGLAYKCVDDARGAARRPRADRPAASPRARPRSLGLSKRLLNASFETDLADLARARGSLPGAGHHVARPRRRHGRVPRQARRAVHGRVTPVSRRRCRACNASPRTTCASTPSRPVAVCRPARHHRGARVRGRLPGGGIDFGEHPEGARFASCTRRPA